MLIDISCLSFCIVYFIALILNRSFYFRRQKKFVYLIFLVLNICHQSTVTRKNIPTEFKQLGFQLFFGKYNLVKRGELD